MLHILLAGILSFGAAAPDSNSSAACPRQSASAPAVGDSVITLKFYAFPFSGLFWSHHLEMSETVIRGQRSEWIKPVAEPPGTLFLILSHAERTGHTYHGSTRVDTVLVGCSISRGAYVR